MLFFLIYSTFILISDVFYNISQIENKFILAEAIVAYHVLIKRTAVLDNFAKGLATLDVLKAIQENPSQFEHLFLANEALDGCAVVKLMKFSSVVGNIERMLTNLLLNATKQGNCITNVIHLTNTSLGFNGNLSLIAEKKKLLVPIRAHNLMASSILGRVYHQPGLYNPNLFPYYTKQFSLLRQSTCNCYTP